MFRESLLIFILSVSLTSNSFAINISPFDILKKQTTQQQKNVKKTQASEPKNFSGTWKGNCSDGKQSEETQLTIKQTNDHIEIFDRKFNLNILNTTGETSLDGTGFFHVITKWDEEGRLVIRANIAKYTPWPDSPQLDYGWSILTLDLINDKLIFNARHSYYFDHVPGFPDEENHESTECILVKEVSNNKP